jgi:hypothetical protein
MYVYVCMYVFQQTRTISNNAVKKLMSQFKYCGKAASSNPIADLDRPRRFHEAEAIRFQDNRHIKEVRL